MQGLDLAPFIIDKLDYIYGLVKMTPFLGLQFNSINGSDGKIINSSTLTYLVTRNNKSIITMPLTHTK